MDDTLIKVEDLCKIYNPGENEVRALDHVSLEIKKGELVAIIGQSGSGKSTFMNMLGCLDVPTSGKYYLNGTDVSENKKVRRRFGFRTFLCYFYRLPLLQTEMRPMRLLQILEKGG